MVYVKMVNAGYKQPRPQDFSLKILDGAEKPWGRGCATKRPFCGCVFKRLGN